MGFSEILLVMAIALILFGPEDLPDIARTIGKVVFELRKATQDLTKEFQSSVMDNPVNIINKAFEQTTSPRIAEKEAPTTGSEAQKDEINEDLLTYEDEIPDDPLAELPVDMVSYEEKGASR